MHHLKLFPEEVRPVRIQRFRLVLVLPNGCQVASNTMSRGIPRRTGYLVKRHPLEDNLDQCFLGARRNGCTVGQHGPEKLQVP